MSTTKRLKWYARSIPSSCSFGRLGLFTANALATWTIEARTSLPGFACSSNASRISLTFVKCRCAATSPKKPRPRWAPRFHGPLRAAGFENPFRKPFWSVPATPMRPSWEIMPITVFSGAVAGSRGRPVAGSKNCAAS